VGTDAELRVAHKRSAAIRWRSSAGELPQGDPGGDVRRRDHIRELLDDPENLRHDHASGSWSSYETEWLAGQPVRTRSCTWSACSTGSERRLPSPYCAGSRRSRLTDAIVDLDEGAWQRAVTRLRDVRLLAPQDPATPTRSTPSAVREWFASGWTQESGGLARRPPADLRAPARHHQEGKTPGLNTCTALPGIPRLPRGRHKRRSTTFTQTASAAASRPQFRILFILQAGRCWDRSSLSA